MHQVRPRGLKIAFRQFGFHQEVPELQVDLRSILRTALQGNTPSETKARADTRRKPQKGTERLPAKYPGIAKDVHQECVGAVGAIEFAPGAVAASGYKSRSGIHLGKARSPVGLLENPLVGRREKVAVCPSFVFAVDHAGYRAIGHLSAQTGGPQGITVAQLEPQRSRPDGKERPLHSSSLGENQAKVILRKTGE